MSSAPPTSAPGKQRPVRSLWHNRDYLLLWSGQAVSSLGSRISGIAFPLLVLFLTNSPAQAGIAGALFGLPYLVFSLPAGVLADRWDRRHLMAVCDGIRAFNAASIPVMFALGHLSIDQLYVNAFVEGTCFVLFDVAEVSSLRQVVGTEHLATVSAQSQAAASVTALVGLPLGGFLYASVGRIIPFALDAVSYAISALSLLLIRTRFQVERQTKRRSFRAEVTEGLAWLWREPLVRFLAFRSACVNFVLTGTYLILIVVARHHHDSASLIGVMIALGAAGALVGTLLSPRLQRRFGLGTLVLAATWVPAVLYPILLVASTPFLLGLVYAGLVLFSPTSNAAVLSYRLAIIPPDLQGRVNSAARLIAYATVPVASAVAGGLLQSIGATHTILTYAALLLVIAVVVTLEPRLRANRPFVERTA